MLNMNTYDYVFRFRDNEEVFVWFVSFSEQKKIIVESSFSKKPDEGSSFFCDTYQAVLSKRCKNCDKFVDITILYDYTFASMDDEEILILLKALLQRDRQCSNVYIGDLYLLADFVNKHL
ncbi:hypothetical protein [Oceanidesulfovibrio indonesiensis]|uniref:hypothetical protein n=1 Tax=Oceanidesulfovibrio indonesiensis TaxID=54767 RepID=UPI001184CD98|nr:hypothetical protein [Oceanidesulfovibrio indonesiensis]